MDVMSRLRTAYYVAALLRECNDTSVVQAWFQNMNPHLSDISPARALREGTVQRTGPNVVAAARAFISAG